jgi:hypothetical protein
VAARKRKARPSGAGRAAAAQGEAGAARANGAAAPRGAPANGAAAPHATAPPRESPRDRMRRGYARAEERNAAVRAELAPLAPGERPKPLVAATVLAVALGTANLVALIAGVEVEGEQPSAVGVLVFCAVMYVAAAGLWQARYWAVLGFEVLLGLIVLVFSLFLLRASNLLAVAVCVPIIAVAGWLFWKLVRVMGRIQAPQRVR